MREKRSAKSGFTLVEVIVVLVILAILAAILIPAMTGWIDKAKERRLITACRTCVTAAQTLVSEAYGDTGVASVPGESDVEALAGVPGSVSAVSLSNAAVATLTYTDDASGEAVTYSLEPEPHYTVGEGAPAYAGWVSGTAYKLNDTVVADGVIYKYRLNEAGKSPTANPASKKDIWNVVGMEDGSVPQYSRTYHYVKGTIVAYNEKQYRCLVDNGGGTPSASSSVWELVE